MNKVNYPFWVVVNKEISDHVKSWRFIILMGIILLTCMGSLYTSLTNIGAAIKPNDPDGSFLFLKLFTASDGTLPSFVGDCAGIRCYKFGTEQGDVEPYAVTACSS